MQRTHMQRTHTHMQRTRTGLFLPGGGQLTTWFEVNLVSALSTMLVEAGGGMVCTGASKRKRGPFDLQPLRSVANPPGKK